MYHNTTGETGENLNDYNEKAGTQDLKVLNYFIRVGKSMPPSDVWINIFDTSHVPLTSVRRSINTLTTQGYLLKTDDKVRGLYGRQTYKWKLNNQRDKINKS